MSVIESGPPKAAQPAWEIATLFPDQGDWTEADYLSLTDRTRRLVELVNGRVEVLPMPTSGHQNIVAFLFIVLRGFVSARKLGWVIQAPFRVRVAPKQFREPDISLMLRENAVRMREDFWEGADLVVEVVSEDPKDRERDLVEKRRTYAQAKIREYWIIDPREQRVTVLKLQGESYSTHAEAGVGGCVASAVLPEFGVEVDAVLAAAEFED